MASTSAASSTYADAKVLFVSNNLGDSLTRVNAISSTSIATYALYAATLRLLAAHERYSAGNGAGASARRRDYLSPIPTRLSAALHSLTHLYRQAQDRSSSSSSPSVRQARFTVVAIEFGTTVVPLLLSITVSSSTGAALTLSALICALAAGLYRQARILEQAALSIARGRAVDGKGKQAAASDNEDDEDEASALYSQSSYDVRPDSKQRRRIARQTGSDDDTIGDAIPLESAVARRRKRQARSHWESDDEERELEEIERREARRAAAKPRPRIQSDVDGEENGGIRVSIESAADQAHGEAHPPEAWVDPSARQGEGSRTGSPVSMSRSGSSSRRGLGLGLGLGLTPPMRLPSTTSSPAPRSHAHDPFLTVYRAHMMLITCACILAVDFPLFPRALGKCETWGASLMDLGVGSFVFSLGLVGAGAQLKALDSPSTNSALRTLLEGLRKDMGKCLPLLALGLIRAVSVRLTAYPEHITEYGAHWSFFLTLSALPPLKTLVAFVREMGFAGKGRWSTWGLGIAAMHQVALRWGGMQRYVLDEKVDRQASLFAANREGICSLPGYLAIMLLATDMGLYVLPKVDPYQAFRRVKMNGDRREGSDEEGEDDAEPKEPVIAAPSHGHTRTGSDGRIDIKAALTSARRTQLKRLSSLCAILSSWAIIYWVVLALSAWALSFLLQDGYRRAEPGIAVVGATNTLTRVVSRRLANAPYVLWVAAFNASFLAAYACVYRALLLDVEYATPQSQRGRSGRQSSADGDAGDGLAASPSSSSFDSPYTSSNGTTSLDVALPRPLPTTPLLLSTLNTHSLRAFLVANLLTGLVNLSMQTMHASSFVGAVVMVLYLGAVVVTCVGLEEMGGQRGNADQGLLGKVVGVVAGRGGR
ncbi:hypothetical protein BDZ90DRAFT_112662 [Jaminaea rosea]|uniref:GPI-anchored wall transfer protein 1 n=1 Tax=Jaminaea rosea TaxID=1569628 RepID=A0A316V026_9BASI|nr:hypothetical protein BDZ90DRAFT_112662 [Jaminaea rosea]PWN29523.1 hypothetical protein BDZ90DRAFT_112662 [Jaminaea rosea]